MILDTNGSLFEKGRYTFRVAEVPTETEVNGYLAWQWTFEAQTEDGEILNYRERFMVWLLAPLLRGLGFKEITPGKFDFEPEQALDRAVTATIDHVTLTKGASAGKVVARMTDITPLMSPENRAALDAQAPPPEKVGATKDDEEIQF